MKRLSITELEDKIVLKVEHELKGMVAGVSVFLVDDGNVQEITPGVLSPEEEAKIISRDFDRVATQEEIEVAIQILESRDEYMLGKIEKAIQGIGGGILLRMIELGGRYFAYTVNDNLLYTRLAEVLVTPDDLPVDFLEVPLEYLPPLAENLSNVLMTENKKGVTIQFGEGLFIRLKRLSQTIYATVLRLDEEEREGKLRAPLAFIMNQVDGEWVYLPEEVNNKEKLEVEMKKALNLVFNELASVPTKQ